MTNTEVVPADEVLDRVTIYELPNGDEMKLSLNMIREYCVTGQKEYCTLQELNYFMQTCKALRLNPFLKEAWIIKYSKNIITNV